MLRTGKQRKRKLAELCGNKSTDWHKQVFAPDGRRPGDSWTHLRSSRYNHIEKRSLQIIQGKIFLCPSFREQLKRSRMIESCRPVSNQVVSTDKAKLTMFTSTHFLV